MLVNAAERDGLNLRASYMIGDRWRDVEAGKRAGCTTLLVGDGHAEGLIQSPDATVCSLLDAIDWILDRERPAAETGLELLRRLTVSVFADGADRQGMLEMAANPCIRGFTTNPTLMRKAGVQDYRAFAHDILSAIPDRPISFEVFADDFDEMERQAREIAGWGKNVFVKVPVTNTAGTPSAPLIRRLSAEGVSLNVTALTALTQVRDVVDSLKGGAPAYISVFAGRVADTGRDPIPLMEGALELMAAAPNTRLIWASPRELLNVFQADAIGCHVITVTNDLLKKLSLLGKDLHEYSLETVRMFFDDGQAAGYRL
jgi:transaldolase